MLLVLGLVTAPSLTDPPLRNRTDKHIKRVTVSASPGTQCDRWRGSGGREEGMMDERVGGGKWGRVWLEGWGRGRGGRGGGYGVRCG